MKEYKHIITKLRQAQEVCKDANRTKENKRNFTSMMYGYCLGVYHAQQITTNQVDLACCYLLRLQENI